MSRTTAATAYEPDPLEYLPDKMGTCDRCHHGPVQLWAAKLPGHHYCATCWGQLVGRMEAVSFLSLRELQPFRFAPNGPVYGYRGNGWYSPGPYSGGPWHRYGNPTVYRIVNP